MSRRPFSYKDPHYCRVMLVKDAPVPLTEGPVSSSQGLAALVWAHCQDLPSEAMYSIVLDARRRAVAVVQVSIGSLTQALAHPREIFRPCLLAQGAGVAIAHNHPSGDPRPSQEDHALTTRIREAGQLLSIPLLDHVIVGGPNNYFSYAEQGWPRA